MAKSQALGELTHEQQMTLLVAMHVRNELEAFHGDFGNSRQGFLTNEQMKRINIAVRKAIYEVFSALAKGTDTKLLAFLESMLPDYWEMPGTSEFDNAYKEFVKNYRGEKK